MISYQKILFYFWPHVKKYKVSFFGTFVVFAVASTLSNVITPLFIRQIIDAVSGNNPNDASGEIMSAVFLFGLMITLYHIFYRIGDYMLTYTQSNILRELRTYTFEKLNRHSYRFFTGNFSGALVAKANRFVRAFEIIHDTLLLGFFTTTIVLTGTFLVLFFIHPILASIFLFWCIIYITITIFLIKKKMRYDLVEAEEDSKVTARISDVITNILNIKMFDTYGREKKYFFDAAKKEELARRRAWNFQNFINFIQGTLLSILSIGGVYFSVKLWLAGEISAGTVVLVQAYTANIFGQVWNLGKSLSRFAKSTADAKEMVDIFEKTPEVVDPEKPEICRISQGQIDIKDISFKYENEYVLSHLSLSIKSGEKIGLVGSSGVGKSTITKLLLRFVDVESGSIEIDGQDIRNLRQGDLRKNIAYVPQEPILFHRTLFENIAYGKHGATKDDVIRAAQEAHAHGFISKFKHEYETLVGERGIKLSGGERQRVAIARAMLKNAPILILDEATSSLDAISEKLIQDAFEKLMNGRTTLVIAHRLSTIQKMDRIIVLGTDGIVEEGTHQKLLEINGIYASFWKRQSDGFIE